MQEALKKSNTNLLELKEKISELMKNEKILKTKIKHLEIENETLKQNIEIGENYDMDMKIKFQQSKKNL